MTTMYSVENPDSQEGLALRCVAFEFRDELHGTFLEAGSARFILWQHIGHVKESVSTLRLRQGGFGARPSDLDRMSHPW